MTADDMLWVLAAADPSAAFRAWAAQRQRSDVFDEELDSAQMVELDPLRRYDLQATFLHRIRRRARILGQLRANLQRPVWGHQALEWRLRGLVGIQPLAERIVKEFASADGASDDALLTLADFLIVLREVDYQAGDGSLPKAEFDKTYRAFLYDLLDTIGPQVRSKAKHYSHGLNAFLGKRDEAMPRVSDIYHSPTELVLGTRINDRVPQMDQTRQRVEVDEILRRFRNQPGVILADEVGMGKTFVALATAYTVAVKSPRGPVIVLVPANLIDKWVQDLSTFCELYVDNRKAVSRETTAKKELRSVTAFRFGIARHSIELLKLLDDDRRDRCHLVFLAHGAMSRRQSDKWIRLALIAEALLRHGRGKASRLIQVKNTIHRFLARLLWAVGEEWAQEWGEELWQRLLRTAPSTWKDVYNRAVWDKQRQLSDDPVPKAVARALKRIDVKSLAESLEQMPVRARGGDARVNERIDHARRALREVESALWKVLLAQARWRSPLLVMDEAHHLKNPATLLARQLQSTDSDRDLRTGDGAMANAFDRMLFLTATPFQLGHHELVNVMQRFGDVRWDASALGEPVRISPETARSQQLSK